MPQTKESEPNRCMCKAPMIMHAARSSGTGSNHDWIGGGRATLVLDDFSVMQRLAVSGEHAGTMPHAL